MIFRILPVACTRSLIQGKDIQALILKGTMSRRFHSFF